MPIGARSFEELCSALILLTASISRARRNGVSASELEEIEAHAGKAITIARGLGESLATLSANCADM